jgi:Ca2+-binding RTX toxin-like protein
MFAGSRWKTTIGAALMVVACQAPEQQSYDFDATGFDGITSQSIPVLTAGDCVIAGNGDMTLQVGDDELLYVFKRVTDGKVVANALTLGGGECATTATATRKITITGTAVASGSGANKVLIDFLNGTFAPGVKATTGNAHTPGIAIDLLGGTDEVTVRGTTGVDSWVLGSGTYDGIDLNADKAPDIKFVGVESVKMTTGPGADVLTGMGIATSQAASAFGVPMTVFGGDDADTMTSGAVGVQNVLNGGAGNDIFLQQNNKASDQIVGGSGRDTLDYRARSAALTITMGDALANDGDGSTTPTAAEADDVGDDVEIVYGGSAADSIDGTLAVGAEAAPTVMSVPGFVLQLIGGAGNDTLIGGTGKDSLDGGDGDDILRGAAGSDTMVGGLGVDAADYSDHSDHVDPLDNTSALIGVTVSMVYSSGAVCGYTGGTEKDVFNTTAATPDIENLIGSPGDDVLTGTIKDNIIWGGTGGDTINGNDGADTLYGEAGADTINGGNGNDVLVGGVGIDTMNGGAGDDLVDGLDAAATDIVSCGAGNDVALLDNASELSDPDPTVHLCELLP